MLLLSLLIVVCVLAHSSSLLLYKLVLVLLHFVLSIYLLQVSTSWGKGSASYIEYCSLMRILNKAGYSLHLVQCSSLQYVYVLAVYLFSIALYTYPLSAQYCFIFICSFPTLQGKRVLFFARYFHSVIFTHEKSGMKK